ncbi:hypothetical protein [Bacillus sp. JCM 19034]|uniref:hypothetical protein n=1 Tax=Bacillus sp. JCM 19034 TaxID=1481928 RepID=UPI0007866719|nr:hypothetical protein [Bacillus sp. JCM 19034]
MLGHRNNRVKEIGIRFETAPYEPHSKVKKLAHYNTFMRNKDDFGIRLIQKAIKQGIPAKRKNTKLLVMTIPIESSTIYETVQAIKKQVYS